MANTTAPKYFILDSSSSNMMLLYPPPDPSFDDSWILGKRFECPPEEPLVVEIRTHHEKGDLLPFFGTACLISNALYDAIREAGVDNLDVYEAVIRSEDGKVVHQGYKAFNILGVVRVADLSKTVFRDPPGTDLIDANMKNFTIDPAKAKGLLMFRPAEYTAAVVVHESVRNAIEAKEFAHLVFREPSDLITG